MKDKRGPNDLEVVIKKLQLQNRFSNEQLEFASEKIQMLEKQKKYMQDQLRKAGARIKDLAEINKSHQKLVGSLMADKKKPQWDDTE